ncbi:MAG: Uma2 family endonuclease [Armatimonadota bacterium]
MSQYDAAIRLGEESGVRLEVVGGIPVWEALPSYRHQNHVFRIQSSIRPIPSSGKNCGCVHVSDIYVRFPDGSLKRPDIAVFCREPDEQAEAVTLLPEAVIEIISPGYEAKDLSIGVPFYLRSGIKDIIVFDPDTGNVRHFRPGYSEARFSTPVTLQLDCGCQVTV